MSDYIVELKHITKRFPGIVANDDVTLQIKKGEMPVLEIEQTAYLDDGRIFEYSKARHRADCFTLHTVSVR